VRDTHGSCPTESLNFRDCSEYTWSASGEITYFGVELSSIVVNKTLVSSFTYDNFTKGYGPVNVHVRYVEYKYEK